MIINDESNGFVLVCGLYKSMETKYCHARQKNLHKIVIMTYNTNHWVSRSQVSDIAGNQSSSFQCVRDLACWRATVVPCGVCWRRQESQLETARALGCLAGGETCGERRATEPGYSAPPGCSTHPTCSRQDSGRPLRLWAGHQWTLTGPEKTYRSQSANMV